MTSSLNAERGQHAQNLKAIGMMIASMFGFALADTLIRLASGAEGDGAHGASTGQILIAQGLIGVLIFGILMWRNGERISLELISDRLILWRTGSDMMAAACIITALSLMSVGSVSAILQVQPLVVTLGAVLFLGEIVTWRRWSAVFVGFLGVMIIIRPGTAGFDWQVIFVLLGVIGLAGRDILTRLIDKRHSTFAIVTFVSIAIIPLGIFLDLIQPGDRTLDATTLFFVVVSSIVAMISYYVITVAMRIGEISVIAPYRYSRLIAAFLVAYLLLGEKPDGYTIIGSLIVIAAGIFVLYRERIRSPQQNEPES